MSDTLALVTQVIRDVVGDDIELEMPISATTSINNDLELESIDLVVIAEKLQSECGDSVDFADWLSNKELDEIIGLTIGDIVEYIDQCLTSK